MIKEGQQTRIGAERLRGLQKILPEKDEVGAGLCLGGSVPMMMIVLFCFDDIYIQEFDPTLLCLFHLSYTL